LSGGSGSLVLSYTSEARDTHTATIPRRAKVRTSWATADISSRQWQREREEHRAAELWARSARALAEVRLIASRASWAARSKDPSDVERQNSMAPELWAAIGANELKLPVRARYRLNDFVAALKDVAASDRSGKVLLVG